MWYVFKYIPVLYENKYVSMKLKRIRKWETSRKHLFDENLVSYQPVLVRVWWDDFELRFMSLLYQVNIVATLPVVNDSEILVRIGTNIDMSSGQKYVSIINRDVGTILERNPVATETCLDQFCLTYFPPGISVLRNYVKNISHEDRSYTVLHAQTGVQYLRLSN